MYIYMYYNFAFLAFQNIQVYIFSIYMYVYISGTFTKYIEWFI